EFEGKLTANGINNIRIDSSKIGSLLVTGLGSMMVEGSEIKGEGVNIGGNGELGIEGSDLELEDGIDVVQTGKLNLENCDIESENEGIRKDGNENLNLIKTNIISSGASINVFGDIYVNLTDCIFKSYITYAIIIIGNINVDAKNLHCAGSKGLFCNNILKLAVSNFTIDVFSNSLRAINSNLTISNFKFKTKFLDQSLFIDGQSNINFSNGEINIDNKLNLNTSLDYSLIVTTGNTEMMFDNISIKSDREINSNIFLCCNKSSVFIADMDTNGFFGFMDANDYSKIYIEDSKIRSVSSVFILNGSSEVFVYKSHVRNSANFQYVSKDLTHLFLDNVKTTCDSSFSLDHYSEVQTKNSVFKVKNESIVSKGFSVISNTNARWANIIDLNYNVVALINKYKFSIVDIFVSNLLLRIQTFIIKTRNVLIFKNIYKFIYFTAIKAYPVFVKNKNILGIFLRRGMLNRDWIAGSSDIDFFTMTKNNNVRSEIELLLNIHKKYKNIKRIFPIYGENIIMNQTELKFYLKYGDIRAHDIYRSSVLDGQQIIIQDNKLVCDDMKNRIDRASEILNSYILFSSNYFNQKNIINDICFAKATIDILKNIHPDNFIIDSRTDWLKQYIDVASYDEKNILKPLIFLFQTNIRLTLENRIKIFDLMFAKINNFAKFNNEFIVANTKVSTLKINKRHNVNNKHLDNMIDLLQKKFNNEILSIVVDAPGVCKVIIEGNYYQSNGIRYLFDIFKNIKKLAILDATPVLFFTKSMYQMLILARFKSMPLEEYKLTSFSNVYKKRIFFLKDDIEYWIHGKEILTKLLLESLADMAFQINIIDVTKNFDSIKSQLLEVLFNMMELKLYFKNDTINSDIHKKYNSSKMFNLSIEDESALSAVLNVFNNNVISDKEKIMKIMFFIKNIKNDLTKEFIDE
ncbi:MAG: hypothetical protein PHR82_03020, partial [Endomicrobiaceae bacterium]|nr:hypothetical protein [Endomicrobiaceae bacterium]